MASDNSSDDGRGTASALTEAAATEQQHSAVRTLQDQGPNRQETWNQ